MKVRARLLLVTWHAHGKRAVHAPQLPHQTNKYILKGIEKAESRPLGAAVAEAGFAAPGSGTLLPLMLWCSSSNICQELGRLLASAEDREASQRPLALRWPWLEPSTLRYAC